ncbi:MAG: 5-formyltetrahydrofolate cyclo-ligase [Myxococcota bacterium]
MDVRSAKRALRRRAAAIRREALARGRDEIAARVCRNLLAESAIAAASRVVLYAALPDEVASRPLFEALCAAGHTCLFPRIDPGGRLVFSLTARWEDLAPGRHAVLEPPIDAEVVTPGPEDVVVVPGVAFDCSGNRLGRGAGCYDRAFPTGAVAAPILVGMACQAQIVASVPHDSRDRAMDAIVTERAFQWTRGER